MWVRFKISSLSKTDISLLIGILKAFEPRHMRKIAQETCYLGQLVRLLPVCPAWHTRVRRLKCVKIQADSDGATNSIETGPVS